jgi:DNA-binding MarR family transcriptional regulator
MKGRRKSTESDRVLWLLKRAFHTGHRAVSEAIRDYGVTPTQMGALNQVVMDPGLSGADLARRLLMTPQAAQLALGALEEAALVERRPDTAHRRIVRAYPTSEGKQVVKLYMERALDAENEFLAVLDPSERRTLVDLLTRLATSKSRGSESA